MTTDDLASCDCDVYRRIHKWSDDDAKLTRVYSTSTKPPSHTTTSHTTYVTRPTTVTPIYLSKVSSLIFPASSTTTNVLDNHRMTKEPGRLASSSTSTTTRSTTTSTTPSTLFWSSSTTPSSYTIGTFSSSSSTTPLSTFAYFTYTKLRLMSSSRGVIATRMLSTSTSRPTREYTSTTERTRMTTTTNSLLPFRMKEDKHVNDKISSKNNKKLSAKCIEFCRARTTNFLSKLANNPGDPNDLYRENVIDEVPISVDLILVVTADYSLELNEPTSAVYKYVVTSLNDLLVTVYNSTRGFQRLTIRRLRKGSIICEYTISLILKGNGSVSESVLESLYDVEWQHAYLPENIGKINISATRTLQGRQLQVVAQQFQNMCSLFGHECKKQGRICLNDQHRGQSVCVIPCSARQRGDAEVSCLGGRCVLDDSGQPKCVCDSGNTCETKSALPALLVLSSIGAGMGMLLSLLIGLTIYFYSKHRYKSASGKRFPEQHYGENIKISVIEDLKATNCYI
ncbi:uncharacterized protein LOC110461081 [Mizuhopecten yessoensis]|uniref:uncharacterized protein LOC110461081 n=1 Tax=Mizuhopecten yessoensis TaxID=6573 RepID=UPI000B459AA9|nr:uncharacterized protein LOC110461081 [Mizuhopecten yessoensis]